MLNVPKPWDRVSQECQARKKVKILVFEPGVK